MSRSILFPAALLTLVAVEAAAAEQVLTDKLHHLRAGREREWSDFPQQAEGAELNLHFRSEANDTEWTLRLRQQDVKQTWKIALNGKDLERLRVDENDMTIFLPVPPGRTVDGDNVLTIAPAGKLADDIRVGQITLDKRPPARVLGEAAVELRVLDAGSKGTPLPCRITIMNSFGSLASVGAVSGRPLAVRPGVVYTATGEAKFSLPAGEYTIVAGRGFAYGIDSVRISIKPAETIRKTLSIRREAPVDGWVACDTHVHTLTHSGHGDCTEEERMITLAGEGVELPIATDHNCQIDFQAVALKMGVRRYFTPVVGNEVTTSLGHFNVFPLPAKGPVPDWKGRDWKTIFANINQVAGTKAIVLNHPRDLHSGFRPFDPGRHLSLTGEDLDGWILGANAIELVNSGALQSDLMGPVRDWFGLLNRGILLTPAGASDSHDVSRYIVGQGRTYIRCQAERPGEIDTAEAVDHFLKGQVTVSCGLLAQITVNDKHGPGELAPASEQLKVAVRVIGPSWVKADRVELFANGRKIKEAAISSAAPQRAGVKWETLWTLPRFKHDVHLVAVATGPGVTDLYWPIARPYQPTSPVVNRQVIGITGAVWIDGDGDGKKTSAYEYARRLSERFPKPAEFLAALAPYDEAVAAQAAGLLQERKISANDPAIREAARKAGAHVERAFQEFAEAWRESQIARRQPKKP